ncbi:hypothetical protein PDESU_04606 [Pontiella desulfatans]|uniref:Uncharacterized protein n=2 Tax=Pontiella desulfatans TaxID=2750659 RepID=A0A6C2U9F8_PONDE|nr:hypothetical protein PDESU_04606 [Pontiella desulfatans]
MCWRGEWNMLILTVVLLLVSGCTAPYWTARGEDAKDVMTLSIPKGIGVGAQVAPLTSGLG